MKTKRLVFAKKARKTDDSAVAASAFSDESTVQQFTTHKRYVRRPTGERFDERCTAQTMKHPQVW